MEIPNLKTWRTAFLLSIIVPVGLLVTFRLTGIMKGPLTIAETATLKALEWEFTRPSPDKFVVINKSLNSNYASSDIALKQRVLIAEYAPRFMDDPFLDLAVETNSTVINRNGFIECIYIAFKDFKPCEIILLRTMLNPLNLTIVGIEYGGTDCYIDLTCMNHARQAYFSIDLFHWFLRTTSTQNNYGRIIIETIYYNGTTYKKLIQPFELKVMS